MIVWIILYFLAVHFVADFIIQTDWQAQNKWDDMMALAKHVATYSLSLFVAAVFVFDVQIAVTFVFINALLHGLTDGMTSQWTHHYFFNKEWRKGFIAVGADQLIHQVCIIGTIWMAMNGLLK